jgi:hypothetical protein
MRFIGVGMPFFLLVLLQSPCPGQSRDVRTALKGITAANLMRIHVRGAGLVEGHFVMQPGDSLVLVDSARTRAFALSLIDTIWVKGSAANTAAIAAAIPLTVLGTVGSAAWCGDSAGSGSCEGAAMMGGFMVGAVGAGIGAAIGGAVKKWNRRYP